MKTPKLKPNSQVEKGMPDSEYEEEVGALGLTGTNDRQISVNFDLKGSLNGLFGRRILQVTDTLVADQDERVRTKELTTTELDMQGETVVEDLAEIYAGDIPSTEEGI